MKKTIVAAAIAVIANASFATGNHTTPTSNVAVTGTGSNTVISSSFGEAYVSGTGSSVSKASNIQSASSYITGTGSLTSKVTNQYVTLEDCDPSVKVKGTLLTGTASVSGGTSVYGHSTSSNVSTGGGTGSAVATGLSIAEVSGKTVVTNPSMNLVVEGSSFSGTLTKSVAGTNQVGPVSTGITSSSFNSTASTSLFTFSFGQTVGDVKNSSTNVVVRSGDLNCVVGCSNVTQKAVSINSTIEAGAVGNAYSTVTANFQK